MGTVKYIKPGVGGTIAGATTFEETLTLEHAQDLTSAAGEDLILARGGTDEVKLTATVLSPATSDGSALGSGSLMWGDLFLASGAVVNFDNGDVTVTHSAAKVTLGGDGAVELDFNNHEMTNVDINSGAIDGTPIGAGSANTGAFSTLGATGAISGATATDTINGVIINSSAVSSITTLATSGVYTASGAVNITIASEGNDVPLEVTQNDTTNNPVAATITNTGTGNTLQLAGGSGNLIIMNSSGQLVGF